MSTEKRKPKQSIGAWVDSELKEWLTEHDITISKLVNRLIKEYIEKEAMLHVTETTLRVNMRKLAHAFKQGVAT